MPLPTLIRRINSRQGTALTFFERLAQGKYLVRVDLTNPFPSGNLEGYSSSDDIGADSVDGNNLLTCNFGNIDAGAEKNPQGVNSHYLWPMRQLCKYRSAHRGRQRFASIGQW